MAVSAVPLRRRRGPETGVVICKQCKSQVEYFDFISGGHNCLSSTPSTPAKENETMTEPITAVTPEAVTLLLKEAGKVLAELAEKYGVRAVRKRCTYTETEIPVAFKFVVTQVDDSGNTIDPEEKEFRKWAKLYDLDPDDFGKTFSTHQGSYTICGLKTRNRKYPVLARSPNGKVYKFAEDSVKRALLQTAGR